MSTIKLSSQYTSDEAKTKITAESPDDWVEITDPEHVLRDDDEATDKDNPPNSGFISCRALRLTGAKVKDRTYNRYRCRRRYLPKPPAKRRISVPMWLVTEKQSGRVWLEFHTDKPVYSVGYTVEPASFTVEVG